jgi:hypothetical protein
MMSRQAHKEIEAKYTKMPKTCISPLEFLQETSKNLQILKRRDKYKGRKTFTRRVSKPLKKQSRSFLKNIR